MTLPMVPLLYTPQCRQRSIPRGHDGVASPVWAYVTVPMLRATWYVLHMTHSPPDWKGLVFLSIQFYIYAPASLLNPAPPHPWHGHGLLPPCGPVAVVDGRDCWLRSRSLCKWCQIQWYLQGIRLSARPQARTRRDGSEQCPGQQCAERLLRLGLSNLSQRLGKRRLHQRQ